MDLYDLLASEHARVFWRIEDRELRTMDLYDLSLANMHGYFDESNRELRMDL